MGIKCAMAGRQPMNPIDAESAQRLRVLRHALGFPTQAAFAAFLGVELTRWNNFERGRPLSREVAITLATRIPGLTVDWLYFGRTSGLSLELASKLDQSTPPEDTTLKRRRRA
jgi:transcriptional regulator with XRE-family HTH domain